MAQTRDDAFATFEAAYGTKTADIKPELRMAHAEDEEESLVAALNDN